MLVLIWIQTVWHSEIFEKVDFEKSQQLTTKPWKITQQAKSLKELKMKPILCLNNCLSEKNVCKKGCLVTNKPLTYLFFELLL